MSAKHTPGPWRAQKVRGSDGYLIREVDGSVVAETCDWLILAAPEDHAPTGMVPPDQDEADARLIAAAPDLLEACRKLVAFDDAEIGQPGGEFEDAQEAVRLARAAIAKAEGRS